MIRAKAGGVRKPAAALAVVAALALAAPLGALAGAEDGAGAQNAAKAAAAPLPSTPDALVAYVRRALETHDLDAFERLIEWNGAKPLRKRMTIYQLRYSFGRPIKSAVVEPFPSDGLDEANSLLALKPNLPVVERLRIVFDEQPTPDGDEPASVLLLGKEDGVYRVSLLLASGPPRN